MGHPYPNPNQAEQAARWNRTQETRKALESALYDAGITNYSAVADTIEEHAHAIADRLRDGIDCNGVTV